MCGSGKCTINHHHHQKRRRQQQKKKKTTLLDRIKEERKSPFARLGYLTHEQPYSHTRRTWFWALCCLCTLLHFLPLVHNLVHFAFTPHTNRTRVSLVNQPRPSFSNRPGFTCLVWASLSFHTIPNVLHYLRKQTLAHFKLTKQRWSEYGLGVVGRYERDLTPIRPKHSEHCRCKPAPAFCSVEHYEG